MTDSRLVQIHSESLIENIPETVVTQIHAEAIIPNEPTPTRLSSIMVEALVVNNPSVTIDSTYIEYLTPRYVKTVSVANENVPIEYKHQDGEWRELRTSSYQLF